MDIKFDFFKISNEEKEKTIDSVLAEIKVMSFENRIKNIYKIPTRIQELVKINGLWFGSFMKIRMAKDDPLPIKAKISGEVEDIPLGPDEGLGETVGFLYDPDQKILVSQRNWHGIGSSGIKFYFERIGKFSFHMEPIIEQNALDRLKYKDRIRKLEFKLLRPVGKIKKDIQGKSVMRALDLIDDFDSYYIDIKFGFDTSKENKGKILNKQSILNLANKIIGREEEIVEKFRVYGPEDDDEKPDFVDLIQDRINEVVTVEVSRTKKMSFEWMNDLLKSAYYARRKEIILRYIEE